jgi:hypothetical protein
VTIEDEGKSYTITIKGSGSQTFSIKNDEGSLTFPCSAEKTGGCPAGADWGG